MPETIKGNVEDYKNKEIKDITIDFTEFNRECEKLENR